ncbi:MAG: methylated-DNA--protein-cysteine methyltransferase [Rhodocyclaceae bacterium]|nr:MAG: methylated-DNA--protein-cysteine methyltransferase [Rhodocyclaceae bacterium]TND03568.1 MAG: methylated-DNA--protein-cysteine methyltransferase [Rhodocyclaceae bacterium]
MKLVCKTIATPLGPMLLAAGDAGLAGVWFAGQHHHPDASAWQAVKSQRWLDQAAEELQAYFRGQCRQFKTPRAAAWGTTFQRSVWEALVAIPWGATTSYGALAAQLHKPLAARAVGAAVGRNPWSIVVPCHRVLGANGSLTGYAGGLARKQNLLTREGVWQRPLV